MLDVFFWIITLFVWVFCLDAVALAVAIQRQLKGVWLAGSVLLFHCLPLTIALVPGGYGWCEYVGFGALSVHLFAILEAARVDGRIAGVHVLATTLFYMYMHLFLLINAP
jgi:hypothetical protein